MKVSVVILTRNSEKTIRKCLESLLNQSFKPHEIIVVDHSDDRTPEIAKQMGAKVIRVSRKGRGYARNIGIREAVGDIIVFIDSDCIAHPLWLENLIKEFEKNTAIAGVSGNVYVANSEKLIAALIDKITRNKPHYATWNIAYRKKVLLEVGGFNEELDTCEDLELAWRILEKGYSIVFEPKAIVYHYHREKLLDFLKQQYKYGLGVAKARKIHHKSNIKSLLIIPCLPIVFLKHITKVRDHVLLPFLLTLSAFAYSLGVLSSLILSKVK